jgi:hypothetical protein
MQHSRWFGWIAVLALHMALYFLAMWGLAWAHANMQGRNQTLVMIGAHSTAPDAGI